MWECFWLFAVARTHYDGFLGDFLMKNVILQSVQAKFSNFCLRFFRKIDFLIWFPLFYWSLKSTCSDQFWASKLFLWVFSCDFWLFEQLYVRVHTKYDVLNQKKLHNLEETTLRAQIWWVGLFFIAAPNEAIRHSNADGLTKYGVQKFICCSVFTRDCT